MPDRLLAAERRHNLCARIELDAEAVAVEAGRRLPKLLRTVVGRVLVGRRVAGPGDQGVHDRLRGRQVGIADPQADHVDALSLLLGELALELGEEVRRNRVEAFREPHSRSS